MAAVPHEAVPPHELLGAGVAVVGLEAGVRLHVLRQVVLHLELLGAHGAVEGPQVEVHVHVAVPHALVRERLAAVAHEYLAPVLRVRGDLHGPVLRPRQLQRGRARLLIHDDLVALHVNGQQGPLGVELQSCLVSNASTAAAAAASHCTGFVSQLLVVKVLVGLVLVVHAARTSAPSQTSGRLELDVVLGGFAEIHLARE